jgi:hypothetical protein
MTGMTIMRTTGTGTTGTRTPNTTGTRTTIMPTRTRKNRRAAAAATETEACALAHWAVSGRPLSPAALYSFMSLSLRVAANTCVGVSSGASGSARATLARSVAESVRRNGLVARSSAIVDGSEDSPRARSAQTERMRRASA